MKQVPGLQFTTSADNFGMRVRTAMLETEVGKIDHAQIDSMQLIPGTRALPDYKPIAFDWGPVTTRDTQRFYGYLSGTKDVTGRYQSSLYNVVSLSVMGTGNVLRGERSRSWTNATIKDVLVDVLGPNRINLVMDDHTVRWSRIAQKNESDWSLITRLANQIGYWPYLLYTTLYLLNPDTLMTRQQPVAIDVTSSSLLKQRTSDFPEYGSAQVSGRTGRFMDQATGVVHEIQADARVRVGGSATPATGRTDQIDLMDESYAEAQARLEGIERTNAWHIERTIEVDGRTDLRPLMVVTIPNARVLRTGERTAGQGWEQYDGPWLVKAVQTNMRTLSSDYNFTTELTVVRDARGSNLNVRQRRAAALNFQVQPPTQQLGDIWASAWRNN